MCTPGALQPLQEESGPIGDGHSEHCEGQVRPFGGHCLFLLSFACNACGKWVKISTLLTGDS